MPAIQSTNEACGLALSDPLQTAQKAVKSYREHLFMRSYRVDSPQARTNLTALYIVQELLRRLTPDGAFGADGGTMGIPGETGFPGIDGQVGPFGVEEQQRCREYLAALRAAVREELRVAVNRGDEVRRWWLSVQQRRFMNRML